MINTEIIEIKGKEYSRTYSDSDYMIERDEVQYSEAIDPVRSGRIYTETKVKINEELKRNDTNNCK